MDKKRTGSYYTPSYLASFISKRVFTHFEGRTSVSILEPSVGDGAFVEELKKIEQVSLKLTALDINKEELEKASLKWNKKNSNFKEIDFLEFEYSKKFTLIIGNPPYVKKNRLTSKQIELSKRIHESENLTEVSVKNIWTTFLVKSNKLLDKNGVLAFILPSELLQVTYTEEIREYLKKEFERIEIFTFKDLMFECKGQDTIVLFAYKKSENRGQFFSEIQSRNILEKNNFKLRKNNTLVELGYKWTHHFLSSEEILFLEDLRSKLKTIDFYSSSKPGIVTAANKFFIVNEETEKEYKLSNYTKPIIQKGLFVNGGVVFKQSEMLELQHSNYPTRLLQLNNEERISKKLSEYLAVGEGLGIPDRYKCKIRDKWYVIPNISSSPNAFFLKRSHLYPKLIKNNSGAFVTDSAYKVEMRDSYNLNSFIYSFYNTLTLVFAEIRGRYYGGGVLELTPNEFKKLPIPYTVIDNNQFEDFTDKFENKQNIEEILFQNDSNILNSNLGISAIELEKLIVIRTKLTKKRMRN